MDKNNLRFLLRYCFAAFSLYFIPNGYVFLRACYTGFVIGDIKGSATLSWDGLLYIFLGVMIPYALIIILTLAIGILIIKKNKVFEEFQPGGAVERALGMILVLNLIFTIFYDLGVVGKNSGEEGLGYAFLFSLIPLQHIFYVYYVHRLRRSQYGMFFLCCVIFFLILQFVRGWTAQFLSIGFWLLISKPLKVNRLFLFCVLSIFLFLYAYPVIDAFKYIIRGYAVEMGYVGAFEYQEYLEKLIGRLSSFSNFLFVTERVNELIYDVRVLAGEYDFLRDLMISVAPKKVLGITDFITFNQIVNSMDAGVLVDNSSFNVPIVSRLYVYALMGVDELILFCIIFCVCSLIILSFMTMAAGLEGLVLASFMLLDLSTSTNMIILGGAVYSSIVFFLMIRIMRGGIRI